MAKEELIRWQESASFLLHFKCSFVDITILVRGEALLCFVHRLISRHRFLLGRQVIPQARYFLAGGSQFLAWPSAWIFQRRPFWPRLCIVYTAGLEHKLATQQCLGSAYIRYSGLRFSLIFWAFYMLFLGHNTQICPYFAMQKNLLPEKMEASHEERVSILAIVRHEMLAFWVQ